MYINEKSVRKRFNHIIFFLQALNGFLMMMTQNGKLLYISDNAAEYLGHSMVRLNLITFLKFGIFKRLLDRISNLAD